MSTAAAAPALHTVVVRKVVSASRDRVFDAWTKPELMQQWLNPSGGPAVSSNELRVGGRYDHTMLVPEGEADCPGGIPHKGGLLSYPHHGEYLEIKRPERVVFTWNSAAVSNTRVTVELRQVQGGTEVTITHELLPDTQIASHTQGWEGCMQKLGEFVER